MNPFVEKMLLIVLKQLVTQEVVKQGEVALVAFLREVAANTSNKVDDFMVDLIAEALGVK